MSGSGDARAGLARSAALEGALWSAARRSTTPTMNHASLAAALILAALCACSSEEPKPAPTPAQVPAVDETPKVRPTDPQAPLTALAGYATAQKIDTKRPNWRKTLPKPPKQLFPEGRKYYWNLATSAGDLKIELLTEVAPMHVSSTIFLTQLGYYDGLKFHRVIRGFMAQGGCPDGNGGGGPGYQYEGEFDPKVRHTRGGLLSMANAGAGTDGSQFFVTFKDTPWLDDKHTIFGEVVADSLGTVKALEAAADPKGGETPKLELVIQRATITVE